MGVRASLFGFSSVVCSLLVFLTQDMLSFLMFSHHFACQSTSGFIIQMFHIIKFRNQLNEKSLPLHAKVLRGHLGM